MIVRPPAHVLARLAAGADILRPGSAPPARPRPVLLTDKSGRRYFDVGGTIIRHPQEKKPR